jgi:hypothetical protein
MIKEDFPHCVRLIHTVERQVFDASMNKKKEIVKKAVNSSKNLKYNKEIKDEVELRIFELIDMFIRDSSLGLFDSRLAMIQLLYQSLVLKQKHLSSP